MKNETTSVSILIADDHPLIRHGLSDVLQRENSSFVLYEASDGEEAIKIIEEYHPDISILDFDMPKLSGLNITQKVVSRDLKTAIVILTMYDSEEIFYEALDMGVMGYVLKDGAMTEILECVDSVQKGRRYVSPSLAGLLLKSNIFIKKYDENKLGLSLLTIAEKKVLSLIAQNKTTKQIAGILYISVRTVDRHRENICAKLKLSGHNALLHFVLENKPQLERL